MGIFSLELLTLLAQLASRGMDVISTIEWGKSKVEHWNETGTEPTDADFAELRERRHANDAIINRG